MDEFIRQAYADGMLNDDSHIAPPSMDFDPPPISSYNTIPPSTASTNRIPPSTASTNRISSSTASTNRISSSMASTNRIPSPIDRPEELILISDDDENSFQPYIPPLSPILSNNQIFHLPPIRTAVIKVSLPYTYLSLIPHRTFLFNATYQDSFIKACFSSLVGNPRVIKSEYELQAYLNDGSDCLLVRLASDLVGQRIGITVTELMTKRRECKNDSDRQRFQTDFNERLKKFGHEMSNVNAIMTIRFYSDKQQMPMVIQIDDK